MVIKVVSIARKLALSLIRCSVLLGDLVLLPVQRKNIGLAACLAWKSQQFPSLLRMISDIEDEKVWGEQKQVRES